MKYLKFIIKGYRGISEETEINIEKESLIPIIGKNESGKTTCLEAIHCFDFANDNENNGKHLSNIDNLYSTAETPVIVAAIIHLVDLFGFTEDFDSYIEQAKEEYGDRFPNDEFNILTVNRNLLSPELSPYISALQKLFSQVENFENITIERNIRSRIYSMPLLDDILPSEFVDSICKKIIRSCPYILYFDDFRDRMPNHIAIVKEEANPLYSNWINYLDELFIQTKKDYSVYNLPAKSDSIRRSIITEVQKYLNKILLAEWSKYQFERTESIELKIEYFEKDDINFLGFKIVEKVFIENSWEERFFDISDRSKGFYWYFNFMIKLHFNPKKRHNTDIDTVYLLDEPGSYLHTYALNKLVEQLSKLSKQNKVIYCTHFHNLLNPEYVPINSIRIAEKVSQGKIKLKKLEDAILIHPVKNSTYQPIFDALEVRPPMLEYGYNNIVLVEGIYDYYSFKMFTDEALAFFPCVSASSIVNQIPYMIFLGKSYIALWDNDEEGRSRLAKATELFGSVEAEKFLTLNSLPNQTNTRLEELFDKNELDLYKMECIGIKNFSFNKAILQLFYSEVRKDIIAKYFPKTTSNFMNMQHIILEKLQKQSITLYSKPIEQSGIINE